MVDFQGLLANPKAAIGLGLLTSNTPSQGLAQGMAIMQQQQQALQERQQAALQQQLLQRQVTSQDALMALPGKLAGVDLASLGPLELMQYGVAPQDAFSIGDSLRKARTDEQRQALFGQLFGGGQMQPGGQAGQVGQGLDPMKIAAYAASTGDQTMMALANLAQGMADKKSDRNYQRQEKIDTENRDKARKVEEKRAEVSVPGFDIAEGAQPATKDAEAMKQVTEANRNLQRILTSMKTIVSKSGTEYFGENAKELQRLHSNAMIQIKNLEDLGAIQAPDKPLMETYLPDPTSFAENRDAILPFAGGGKESIINRMDAFDKELNDRVLTKAQTLGYKSQTTEFNTPPPKPPGLPSGAMQAPPGAVKAYRNAKNETIFVDSKGNRVGG
jgi:hypothetical protein